MRVLRINSQGGQEFIPVVRRNTTSNYVEVAVEHFTSYLPSCVWDSTEYRWDMDSSSETGWEEASQNGKLGNYTPDTPRHQFGESFYGKIGLKMWAQMQEGIEELGL